MRTKILLIFPTLLLGSLLVKIPSFNNLEDPFPKKKKEHEYVIKQAHEIIGFDLIDPEQSPPELKESVMRGYHLVLNTAFHAPDYVHDQLSCTSCHFCGGDTLGGRNNGISLVGVTNVYPQFSERNGKTITLAERVNNCFQRSMNGKALPIESQQMNDILSYLKWISHEVFKVKNPPWLGLKLLKSSHKADSANGEYLYSTYCASCHNDNGQGGGELPEPEGKTIPPLWGEASFNDGAGMSTPEMLSAFIYWNMPYKNSVLTEEQAIDIAAFVLKQPRSHFE